MLHLNNWLFMNAKTYNIKKLKFIAMGTAPTCLWRSLNLPWSGCFLWHEALLLVLQAGSHGRGQVHQGRMCLLHVLFRLWWKPHFIFLSRRQHMVSIFPMQPFSENLEHSSWLEKGLSNSSLQFNISHSLCLILVLWNLKSTPCSFLFTLYNVELLKMVISYLLGEK